MNKLIILTLIVCVALVSGCRRVTVVSDSLLFSGLEKLKEEVNTEANWVYTVNLKGGRTSYDHPILKAIYSEGLREAFGYPDAVLMSIGTNDSLSVARGHIEYDDALASITRLITMAAEAGAQCIVLLEGSHNYTTTREDISEEFTDTMDNLFADLSIMAGERSYLGFNYKLIISDIDTEYQGYFGGDSLHFSEAGDSLAAELMAESLAKCPPGRWIFGKDKLKPEAVITLPWHNR